MKIVVEKKNMNKKNRKELWSSFCINCRKEFDFENDYAYYETLGYSPGCIYVGFFCSYICAKQQIESLALLMFKVSNLNKRQGFSYGELIKPYNKDDFKEFFNNLDKQL